MIGTNLAHYRITSHLGTGGMGEVYQATDSRLGRNVAIKLLPEALSHDNDRTARFEREAQALAALNHSNIASIYGVEESSGRKFLIMELIEGDTLAEKIALGPNIEVGIPKPLFQVPGPVNGSRYAMSVDGREFIIPQSPQSSDRPSLTTVLNWAANIKK